MELIKEICFWLVFSAGFIVSLIGVGMLLDSMLKRYMVYKEIYTGFLEHMTAKIKNERKSRQ